MLYLIEELWRDGTKFRVGIAQDYLKAKDRFQAQVDKLKVIHGFNAVSHVHSESSCILARRHEHETVVVSVKMVNAEPAQYLRELEEYQTELQHERLGHGWCEACEHGDHCPGMSKLSHQLQDITELIPMVARMIMLPTR